MRKVNFNEFTEILPYPYGLQAVMVIFHNTPFSIDDFYRKCFPSLYDKWSFSFDAGSVVVRECISISSYALDLFANSHKLVFVYGYDGNNGNPMSPYVQNSKFLCINNTNYKNIHQVEISKNMELATNVCAFYTLLKMNDYKEE